MMPLGLLRRAAVQPDDRRAEGMAVGAHRDDAQELGGMRYAEDVAGRGSRLLHHLARGGHDRAPPVFRLLLGPIGTRIVDRIRGKCGGAHLSVGIHQHCLVAAGADIVSK